MTIMNRPFLVPYPFKGSTYIDTVQNALGYKQVSAFCHNSHHCCVMLTVQTGLTPPMEILREFRR